MERQNPSPPLQGPDPHEYFLNIIVGCQASTAEYQQLVQLLWDAYAQDVFLYAYGKLEKRDDAREICQDTFLRALNWIVERPTQVPLKLNFPAWLRRIARNLIVDRFRNAARELPASQLPARDDEREIEDWPEGRERGPHEELSVDEQLAALRDCIDQLSDRWRRLVVLRDLNGCDYADIARELGMAVATVHLNIHRARKALRECVDQKFADGGGGQS